MKREKRRGVTSSDGPRARLGCIFGKEIIMLTGIKDIPGWLREHFRFLQSKPCIADQ